MNWTGGTIKVNGTMNVTAPLVVSAAGGTLDSSGYDGTIAGVVSGTSLTKIGAGSITLAGDNTYSGGKFLNAGTLRLASDHGAGTGAINVASAGGVVELADGVTVSNAIKTAYGFEVLNVADDGASGTFAGSLTQTANNAIRVQATGAGATLNVTGSIASGSRNFFVKTGNVVVAGSGSITGTGGAIGRGVGSANLTVQDNANFNIGGFSMGGGQAITDASVTVAGNATLSTGTAPLDLLSTTSTAAATSLNLNGGVTTNGSFLKSSTGATQTSP